MLTNCEQISLTKVCYNQTIQNELDSVLGIFMEKINGVMISFSMCSRALLHIEN